MNAQTLSDKELQWADYVFISAMTIQREAVKKLEIMFQGQVLNSLTISMGVAVYPESGTTIDDLMRTADIALYKAKQAGRDRITLGTQLTKME